MTEPAAYTSTLRRPPSQSVSSPPAAAVSMAAVMRQSMPYDTAVSALMPGAKSTASRK